MTHPTPSLTTTHGRAIFYMRVFRLQLTHPMVRGHDHFHIDHRALREDLEHGVNSIILRILVVAFRLGLNIFRLVAGLVFGGATGVQRANIEMRRETSNNTDHASCFLSVNVPQRSHFIIFHYTSRIDETRKLTGDSDPSRPLDDGACGNSSNRCYTLLQKYTSTSY